MGQSGELHADQAHRGYNGATDAAGYAALNPLYMRCGGPGPGGRGLAGGAPPGPAVLPAPPAPSLVTARPQPPDPSNHAARAPPCATPSSLAPPKVRPRRQRPLCGPDGLWLHQHRQVRVNGTVGGRLEGGWSSVGRGRSARRCFQSSPAPSALALQRPHACCGPGALRPRPPPGTCVTALWSWRACGARASWRWRRTPSRSLRSWRCARALATARDYRRRAAARCVGLLATLAGFWPPSARPC
jgi:hypothetical protein